MARYNPNRDVAPLLAAAAVWKDNCLIEDGSLFLGSVSRIWTRESALILRRDFVERPDLGEGDFLEKLKAQLANSGETAQRLAAEMLWALLLFQSNISPPKKREIVTTIWSWSGGAFPQTTFLDDTVLIGVGSTGQAFNTHRWRELAFLIECIITLKSMSNGDRIALLSDPWRFGDWLEAQRGEGYRQLPNLLRYLLFPDEYERISIFTHKRQILMALAPDLLPAEERDMPLDRGLLALRQRLSKDREKDFDFYEAHYEASWRTVSAWLLSWNPNNWAWESFAEDRAIAAAGKPVKHQWRCSSKKPEVGHIAYLYRSGEPPRGIIARGKIVKPSYEDDHFDPDEAHEGKKIRYIDVAFDDIRDARRDAIVPLETLVDTYPDQQWSPQGSGIEIRPKAAQLLDELWTRLPAVEALPLEIGELPTKLPMDSPRVEVTDVMEGLFMEHAEFLRILNIWRAKKNLILQGAPGTGKSFVARRLAYALLGERDDHRIETVQFHQSYSYEDFVQGYRPTGTGGFELRDGAFLAFCRRALADPEREYVFIVDEINRGNLAKILGELMLLIEHDKRRIEWGARLAYANKDQPRFYVPENVMILGMMNTADRSLSLVDYALRRRFSFVTLSPQFESPGFTSWLLECGIDAGEIDALARAMAALNVEIAKDIANLGRGFRIGHSFFVPRRGERVAADWRQRVVETEIRPLLEEYWSETPEKVEHWCGRLVE